MIDYVSSPPTLVKRIAERAREARLRQEWRQEELAKRAGVSPGMVRRFEKTGSGTLLNVARIAFALRLEQPLRDLFATPAPRTIDEALAPPAVTRRRAPRRR